MSSVASSERGDFFKAVEEASRKAVWCALATSAGGAPRVRIVHPTWEGQVLWFATGTDSPKVAELRASPEVAIQYQVAPPDFVHVCVNGRATIVEDREEKQRVWKVIDYDLAQFWPGGPDDPTYTLVRVDPDRVELSRMFGSQDRRVWTRPARGGTR
jgi:general stress protein 26